MSYRPKDAVQHVCQDLGSGTVSCTAVKTVLVSALESLLEIVPVVRLADITFVTLVAGHVYAVTSPVQMPTTFPVGPSGLVARNISAVYRLTQESGPALVGSVVSVIYPIPSGFKNNCGLGPGCVSSAQEHYKTQKT